MVTGACQTAIQWDSNNPKLSFLGASDIIKTF